MISSSLKKAMEILKCRIVDTKPLNEIPPGEMVVTARELELMALAVGKAKKRQYASYDEYLQSDEWKIRKRIVLQNAKNRCQLCNKTNGLNVHHRTYDNIYNETLEDLLVLCRACHEKFHGIT